ncbi:MAG TPA: endonuclease domain-containing protein [Desulfomonilia bacterium]|nr:endonuclease domain-containing protein [Desulfomonilia bacterium]
MSVSRARSLRKGMTDAEQLLWRHLRNRRLDGHKFRRQHSIGPFVADFVCIEKGVIVELDGGQHVLSSGKDGKRTRFLESKGFRVLRFWNHDVLKETEAVLITIQQALTAPSPRPSPPEGGEGIRSWSCTGR